MVNSNDFLADLYMDAAVDNKEVFVVGTKPTGLKPKAPWNYTL